MRNGVRVEAHRYKCKSCWTAHQSQLKRRCNASPAATCRILFTNAKRRAQENSWEFDLSREWIRERIECGACEATGLPFDLSLDDCQYKVRPFRPSLDRIDGARGYTKDNVRVVLACFNLMRNEYDDELVAKVWDGFVSRRSADDDGVRQAYEHPPQRGPVPDPDHH